MAVSASDGRGMWRWSLVLAAALHLLSTASSWWITDHGEILAAADRFLASGHLDLRELGPGWEDWSRIVAQRPSAETRFLPLSILPLVPLLALDHLFGARDPRSLHFVYLEGHLFVLAGLWLVGRFAARRAGDPAAALAVLLLGLNWPVWMIARRIGPEPVLFALLAALAAAGPTARFVCLLLLPWVHASGPVLGLGALFWVARVEGSPQSRGFIGSVLGWIGGLVSVALLWNLPVHGSLLMGGYRPYASDAFFVLNNPLTGTLSFLAAIALWTLPLWYLAFRAGRETWIETVALWLPALLFFGLFSRPEPLRRLAPLLGAWVIAVFARLAPWTARQAAALSALALASGVLGLSGDFVDVVPTPLGLFSGPRLFFLHLAFADHRPWLAASMVTALFALAFVAGSRTLSLLRGPIAAPAGMESSEAPGPG